MTCGGGRVVRPPTQPWGLGLAGPLTELGSCHTFLELTFPPGQGAVSSLQ